MVLTFNSSIAAEIAPRTLSLRNLTGAHQSRQKGLASRPRYSWCALKYADSAVQCRRSVDVELNCRYAAVRPSNCSKHKLLFGWDHLHSWKSHYKPLAHIVGLQTPDHLWVFDCIFSNLRFAWNGKIHFTWKNFHECRNMEIVWKCLEIKYILNVKCKTACTEFVSIISWSREWLCSEWLYIRIAQSRYKIIIFVLCSDYHR